MLNKLINWQYEHFRFLNAPERQKIYITILFYLYDERLAHQTEIFHDDLYLKVTSEIERLTENDYHEELFRQDIEKLVEWGNIIRKLEGRRVRSLTDNSLRRNLLKISEETFQLLRYLLQQSRPGRKIIAARGFLLLQDISTMLDELEQMIETFFDGNRETSMLQRAGHLISEMDSKIDDAVAELTGLADHLHSFLETGSIFEAESYEQMMKQLQTYNQEWLSRLGSYGGRIFSRLRAFEKHLCFAEFAETLKLQNDNFSELEDPTARLSLIVSFFDPGSGRLDFYCRRVYDELHFAIKRISNYIRLRDDRTLRIQEIRQRTTEMTTASASECTDWINKLYSSVLVPVLAADGTPDERCQAPQPRRSSSKGRGTQSAQAISPKKLSIADSRELERQKIQNLNEFFIERVLQGKSENQVNNANFSSIEDAKKYMQGLKLSLVKNRKASQSFKVEFDRPADERDRAEFALDEFEFNCPDHLVRRKTE